MAIINNPKRGIVGEDWPELDGMAPHEWDNHIRKTLQERDAQAAQQALGAPQKPQLPSEAPQPGADFSNMLKTIQQNMAAPAAAPPARSGGLADIIKQAFQPSTAPAAINVPIKAGMTPEQVTAVNQQLLGEQELAARTAQADKENARQDQQAAIQQQNMDMERQMQQVKLAEMLMPKRDIQIAPDGTVIDVNNMVGQKLGQAPLTAAQLADQAYKEKAFGLDEQQLAETVRYHTASLAQDEAQSIRSAAAARAGSGGGEGKNPFIAPDGFAYERGPDGNWQKVAGDRKSVV